MYALFDSQTNKKKKINWWLNTITFSTKAKQQWSQQLKTFPDFNFFSKTIALHARGKNWMH